MKSVVGLLASVALLASAAGCTMCQAPFDYCNPVIGRSGCLNCDFQARRGSVFHPMDDEGYVAANYAAPQAVPGVADGQGASEITEQAPSAAEPTPLPASQP